MVCGVQLYDATGGKMKLLMIRACEPSVHGGWMKGDFLDNLMLVAWSREDGRAFIYKLSARLVSGLVSGQPCLIPCFLVCVCVFRCVPGITESVEEGV